MTNDERGFDVFLSYSTAPDYKLARKLEVFIERFHRSRTAKSAGLPALDACLDGSDFVMSAKRGSGATEQGQPASIPEIVESNLARSRQLLVLCSPQSMRSPWVRQEIRWFLDNRGPGAIRLALTRGDEAGESPESFFAPEILEARLYESVWYDLRGFYRDQRKLPKVRDLESERLRFVADLHGRSASDIEPLWQREQRQKARRRYAAITAALSLTVILGSTAYVQSEIAEAEQDRRIQEQSLKQVAQSYRHLFSDPFSAAAQAYGAHLDRPSEDADAAMSAVHQVLIERQRIAREERTMARRGGFSFVAQATSGLRFTRLSRDGSRVLVMTERSKDDPYSPDARGEVHVLDNRTLELVHLAGCDNQTRTYRLEFADFIGEDKILVARGFHVELYNIDGSCLLPRSFQLRASKTPVSAAGGLLHGIFFVAGNGAGCLWVNEFGGPQLVDPSRELGAVTHCDDKRHPNALLQVQVDPTQTVALNLFQTGRLDLFAMDGFDGRPKRRPVLQHGVRSVAFRPAGESISFALSTAATGSQPASVERWELVERTPTRTASFPLAGDAPEVGFMGFSEDGRLLIAVDDACALQIWDFQSGTQLLHRPADGLTCPPPSFAAPEPMVNAGPREPQMEKSPPAAEKRPATKTRRHGPDRRVNLQRFAPESRVVKAKDILARMKPGERLALVVPDPQLIKPLEAMIAQEKHRVIHRARSSKDPNRRFLLIERGKSSVTEPADIE